MLYFVVGLVCGAICGVVFTFAILGGDDDDLD